MCVLPRALISGSERTTAAMDIPEVRVSSEGDSELTRVIRLVGATGVVLGDS